MTNNSTCLSSDNLFIIQTRSWRVATNKNHLYLVCDMPDGVNARKTYLYEKLSNLNKQSGDSV